MHETLYDDELSELVLTLHRSVGTLPVESFKPWVLAQLSNVIRFDRACWLTGGVEPGTGRDHCLFDCSANETAASSYACPRSEAAIGETLTVSGSRTTNTGASLNSSRRDEKSELCDSLTLCRVTDAEPFSGKESLLLTLLLPQMSTVQRQNLLYTLQQTQCSLATGFGAHAICDESGILHRASDAFTHLLLLEVPEWQGPALPWRDEIGACRKRHIEIKGERVVMRGRRSEKLFHLHLRTKTQLDDLSAAEMRVASALAAGGSYKTVARQLKLSPSTVNNHAANIYQKTGVHNKGAFIARWRELGGDT